MFPPSPPHCSKASVTPRAQSPVSRPHPYYYPPRAAPQPRRAPAALLREHTPVLTPSRRRRFRKRTKRSPDGADAGPPAEPRTGTAETGGEAARALQPGRAAPLPPARRGGPRTAPRPGEAPRAGPERVAPESRRRKARPRPLPARPPASHRCGRVPGRGRALPQGTPCRRPSRCSGPRGHSSPAAHGTEPPTPTGETVTGSYSREPPPTACAIQTAPRCMLGRAPPRSASDSAVPCCAGTKRPLAAAPQLPTGGPLRRGVATGQWGALWSLVVPNRRSLGHAAGPASLFPPFFRLALRSSVS